jgi:hypothetical protein
LPFPCNRGVLPLVVACGENGASRRRLRRVSRPSLPLPLPLATSAVVSLRYLLPCSCGKPTAVSSSQAGGAVVCASCGATLEAPRLRDLQKLPTAGPAAAAKGGWGARQGVLSAGLMLGGLLAGLAGWIAANEPAPPKPFDAAARRSFVDQGLDTLPPVELWKIYTQVYEPLAVRGFEVAKSPVNTALEALIAESRWRRNTLLIAAAAIAATALAAYALIPAKQR